jgi:hypothetical protein
MRPKLPHSGTSGDSVIRVCQASRVSVIAWSGEITDIDLRLVVATISPNNVLRKPEAAKPKRAKKPG